MSIDERTYYSDSNYKPGIAPKHAISPVDLTATLALPTGITVKFATLTMVSVSQHRDKFPVSVISRVGPVGFTLGHRMIAGSLVFNVFDRAAFSHALDPNESYARYPDQKSRQDGTPKIVLMDLSPDELPPFDIHMIYSNSEGTIVYEGLRGVTILDTGALRSMELMQIQESYSFMARQWIPLQPLNAWINAANLDVYKNKVNELNNITTNWPDTTNTISPVPTNYAATPAVGTQLQKVHVFCNGVEMQGVPIYNSAVSEVLTSQIGGTLFSVQQANQTVFYGTIAGIGTDSSGNKVHVAAAISSVNNTPNSAPDVTIDASSAIVVASSNTTVS